MSTTTGTSTIKTTYSLNLHYKQKVWTFPVDFGCMTFNEEKFPDDKKGCLNWNTWSIQKLSEIQKVGEL